MNNLNPNLLVQNVSVKKEVNNLFHYFYLPIYLSFNKSIISHVNLEITIDAHKAPIIKVASGDNLEDNLENKSESEPELDSPKRIRKKRGQ